MRSPGLDVSSARASRRPACAVPARPTLAVSGSASCSGFRPSAFGQARHAARVRAVEDHRRQRRRLDSRARERALRRVDDRRRHRVGGEALLPLPAEALLRQPPHVENLDRRRGAADQSSDRLAVAAGDERHRGVAALALARAARSAHHHVARADQRAPPGGSRDRARAAGRRAPCATSRRARPTRPARGRSSAAWIVAAFSFSAYGGLSVAKSSASSAMPPRTASRAASTAIDTESSS